MVQFCVCGIVCSALQAAPDVSATQDHTMFETRIIAERAVTSADALVETLMDSEPRKIAVTALWDKVRELV
jgi:hypothetical protein